MKIKDICTSVTDGSHNPPLGIEKSEYMMLSSKNIFDDEITFDEPRFLTERDFEKEHRRTKIAVGDVLFTIVGTVGRIAVVDEDMSTFALQRSVAVLHPKNDVCLPRFLMYALRGKRTYIENRAKGVAQKGIYLKEVSDIDIHIPDISNQEIIINKLDKVNAIIKLRQKELLVLDNFIKARFVEMFGLVRNNVYGYKIKMLQDVCEPIKDGTHQTPTYVNDAQHGFKFLSSKDVTSGKINWSKIKYIPSDLHEELYAKIKPKRGDILLAKNGTTGVAAVVETDEIFDIYVSLALLRPIDMNSIYLWAAVNSADTKHQFDSSLKGIGVPNLHLGEIKKTKIIVPPLELQNQFADFVHQVDKSKVVA